MSKLKADVERLIRDKIEGIADIVDNPTTTEETKILQLSSMHGIDRRLAKRLVKPELHTIRPPRDTAWAEYNLNHEIQFPGVAIERIRNEALAHLMQTYFKRYGSEIIGYVCTDGEYFNTAEDARAWAKSQGIDPGLTKNIKLFI